MRAVLPLAPSSPPWIPLTMRLRLLGHSTFWAVLFLTSTIEADTLKASAIKVDSIKLDELSKKIIWAKNFAPPFYIKSGRQAGKGFADGVQAMLEQELPQFDHQTVYMPLARLNDFWRKQDNYCFASMIFESLPPNTDYLLSRPNVFYFPHGIITRNSFPPARDVNEVALSSLLKNPNWIMGLINNRSFDATIDELMLEHEDTTRTFVRSDKDGLRRLLDMLLLERIDYLLDYPFVYHYYAKQAHFSQQLKFLKIRETKGAGVFGAVGCTNNVWGEQVMVEMNAAIDRLVSSPQYQHYVAEWQAADNDSTHYWQNFHRRAKEARIHYGDNTQ
jgi:uncharacterized protein (TIGR02285 family)